MKGIVGSLLSLACSHVVVRSRGRAAPTIASEHFAAPAAALQDKRLQLMILMHLTR
jgi:hypothetical protein